MRSREHAALALAALLAWPCAADAGISVPAGGRLALNGGSTDLAAQELRVDGAFSLGSGALLDAGALRIGAGGQADLGAGLVDLLGDWENRGSVAAGNSRVNFLDGAAQSSVLGSTAFANLSFVSANGKRYLFESGSTQIVSGQLQIVGNGTPIQVDVTQPGTIAFLNLLPSGSQVIANVGVSDVHAVGQPLAPDQTNQGGRGNDTGWFGGGGPVAPSVPVPTSSPLGLLLFALSLLGAALVAFRRLSTSGASS